MKKFNQGIILSSLGSFWGGVSGVIYVRSLSFVGPFELVYMMFMDNNFLLIAFLLL